MMAAPAMGRRGESDGAVIGLVGLAHFMSHLQQLALPPLIPLFHASFGVSYFALGIYATLFYAASGLGQAAAGVLVDRYGAQRLLALGLTTLSASIVAVGLVTAYWMLLPLAVIAGLGNSVFHPADLSILSHRVSERRLGRAFAAHGVSGSLGYAAAPLAVLTLAEIANWHVALIVIGGVGLAVAGLVAGNRRLLAYTAATTRAGGARRRRYLDVIGAPVVLMAFAYFAMTSFAGSGMQNWAVTALATGYDFSLAAATRSLSLYLLCGGIGMVLGGFLAERTSQHHRVAMSGIAIAALIMLAIAAAPLAAWSIPALLALAGLANGCTGPSRDVLVRRCRRRRRHRQRFRLRLFRLRSRLGDGAGAGPLAGRPPAARDIPRGRLLLRARRPDRPAGPPGHRRARRAARGSGLSAGRVTTETPRRRGRESAALAGAATERPLHPARWGWRPLA
jgi:MFS family permease